MSAPFGLSRIGQVSMTARDLDRATAFYRDALGMKHLFSVPNMAFFAAGEVRLMLALPEPEYDHPGSVLYFDVPDIRAAHASLTGRGVEFLREPFLVAPMPDHDLWMAFLKDTEGNTLALMSQVPRANG